MLEDVRAAFEAYSRETRRKFSGETWTRYVEYLRDGIAPPGPTARALKAKIEKSYYWDSQRHKLIYKQGNLIAIHEEEIFDLIANEYERLQFRGCFSLWRAVRDKYHGILQDDTKKFIAICKSLDPRAATVIAPFTHDDRHNYRPITRFSDIALFQKSHRICGEYIAADGRTLSSLVNDEGLVWTDGNVVRMPDFDGYEGGGYGDSVGDNGPRYLPDETEQWVEWLRQMSDREWPQSLKSSRYKDMIHGLYTILRIARPASAYVPGSEAQAGDCPVSYGSADVLYLTMEQATDELENSEGPPRPIFITADNTTTKDLGTIENCLKVMRQFIDTVTVHDLGRRRDESSSIQWPTDEVVLRFQPYSKPPEDEPPINLLDIGIVGINGVPDCLSTDDMIFLMKFRTTHGGRPLEPRHSFWNKIEKWRLLGQRGSGTMTHQDHCGFWTWVKVEEGKKLWMICQLDNDNDRARFAAQGTHFTGGQWFYIWLEPGQVLVIPPGTIYAVFTPVDTLCVGGNAWSQRHMGATMRAIAFETKHPKVTNYEPVAELANILERVARHMETSKAAASGFGGEEHIAVFREYYDEYLQLTKPPPPKRSRSRARPPPPPPSPPVTRQKRLLVSGDSLRRTRSSVRGRRTGNGNSTGNG
ncbi:MAG: hypothetical protein M1839_001719 [Geoglossum umbratile]|nr:MAG: hypothetical protein M1839_001719 [Geoglossum umbratile]